MGFLLFILVVVVFIIGAGATHGYAKHRWPSKIINQRETDDSDRRILATIFWPFYWIFVWPFTKADEITLFNIEKQAGRLVLKNRTRIADIHATRKELEVSNAELEAAEAELNKEIAKGL